jgi:pimeloyl-ACP methyl ester carboxylesterase
MENVEFMSQHPIQMSARRAVDQLARKIGGLNFEDLRGIAQLATDGTQAVSDMAQDLHERIATPLRLGARGVITDAVYASVRGVSRLVGKGTDLALGALANKNDRWSQPSSGRENVISILNGVCGDHLYASQNPLAMPMTLLGSFAHQGKYALFIHGLCLNDSHWRQDALVNAMQSLGFTPIFLRYNSGRRIAENGAELAALLGAALHAIDCEIVVLAHSMGGLVLRSALQIHAQNDTEPHWRQQIQRVIFLGTPHLGAPLERAGHWVETLWHSLPFAAALAPIAGLRSAGITDLRHGQITAGELDAIGQVQLPKDIACYAIAASLGKASKKSAAGMLGDGLVPVSSALAQADGAQVFAPERCAVLYGIGHLQLLYAPAVVNQVRQWMADA